MPSIDSPLVRSYWEAADRYRSALLAAPQRTLGQFLREVEPALALLYSAAAELPEVAPDTDGVADKRGDRDAYRKLQGSVAKLLGRFDAYQDIFNPSDPGDHTPVQYLLSLELVEILEDLDEGRSLSDPSRSVAHADVLWQLRFDFTSHWGRHAASALKVINALLHTEAVDALESRRADA